MDGQKDTTQFGSPIVSGIFGAGFKFFFLKPEHTCRFGQTGIIILFLLAQVVSAAGVTCELNDCATGSNDVTT